MCYVTHTGTKRRETLIDFEGERHKNVVNSDTQMRKNLFSKTSPVSQDCDNGNKSHVGAERERSKKGE